MNIAHNGNYSDLIQKKSKKVMDNEKKTLASYGIPVRPSPTEKDLEMTDSMVVCKTAKSKMSMTHDYCMLGNPIYARRLAYLSRTVPPRFGYLPVPEFL